MLNLHSNAAGKEHAQRVLNPEALPPPYPLFRQICRHHHHLRPRKLNGIPTTSQTPKLIAAQAEINRVSDRTVLPPRPTPWIKRGSMTATHAVDEHQGVPKLGAVGGLGQGHIRVMLQTETKIATRARSAANRRPRGLRITIAHLSQVAHQTGRVVVGKEARHRGTGVRVRLADALPLLKP